VSQDVGEPCEDAADCREDVEVKRTQQKFVELQPTSDLRREPSKVTNVI
jgi:hypothetical protein